MRKDPRICPANLALTTAPEVSPTSGRSCFAPGLTGFPDSPSRRHAASHSRPEVGTSAGTFSGLRFVFLLPVSSPVSRPHCAAAKPARPLTVPSKDYSRGGGLAAALFSEGRETEDERLQHKKTKLKTMKTKKQSTKGLKSRSEQLSAEKPVESKPVETSVAEQPTLAGVEPERKEDGRLPIDLERRRANRKLQTEKLIALLRAEAPRFFEVAEIVGKWVWVQFNEKQPREVTAVLAQLGFHWNNKRQVWQHPCGTYREESSLYDPRKKYRAYFAADRQPA